MNHALQRITSPAAAASTAAASTTTNQNFNLNQMPMPIQTAIGQTLSGKMQKQMQEEAGTTGGTGTGRAAPPEKNKEVKQVMGDDMDNMDE